MSKPLYTSLFVLALTGASNAQLPVPGLQRGAIGFVQDPQRMPDDAWQTELRSAPAWRSFVTAHAGWNAEFNENNRKPHRAWGDPIATNGADAGDRAMNFIAQQLSGFGLPMQELAVKHISAGHKYTYVHIAQRHNGLDVLFSKVLVKLDGQGRVVLFGLDVHNDITLDATPALDATSAESAARAGLENVVSSSSNTALRILPLPVYHGVEHHLVYEVAVETRGGVPGRWTCFVDANSGKLLYRQNRVLTESVGAKEGNDDGADVVVQGNVSVQNTNVPPTQQGLRNLHITVGGQPFTTDASGFVTTGVPGPVAYNLPLAGDWSAVATFGDTPTLSGTLQDGPNLLSFDGISTLQERSAYFHVNNIHDHMKAALPDFDGMDFSLPTNVDLTNDNCNAFYDGSSINFYALANDCYSMALISDVPYHEYGHGINDNFYQANGSFFTNGGMNEGYADFWAFSLTQSPTLGLGYKISEPNTVIRRYDENPKVFPVDLTGEVHANGEIIAGAWWDTYVQLGNDMPLTIALFTEAYPGLQAEAPDGQEGQAFRDVLLDVLQADDDDAVLSNGTPHGNAIVEAFRIHGITLVSGFDITHTPIAAAPQNQGITVSASATVNFPYSDYLQGMQLNYRVNAGPWEQTLMTANGGNDYEGTIPAQPLGTVVAYYIGLLDINNVISSVVPPGADTPEPNIPYFILIGYGLERTEDADNQNQMGDWHTGVAGDNATTGQWELNLPVGSFGTLGDPTTIVQTDEQHTPGGEQCFITGNASSQSDAIGTDDVDGGRTTLLGDPIDLSTYTNPTFTYWRWYTNNPPSGANPHADWWHVQITNDGVTWHDVENTRSGDRKWRRYAFRVQDVVTPNSTVTLRFIASDSTHIGQELDGGSLVEAAVDDIQLWDNADGEGIEENTANVLNALWPDPANDVLHFALDLPAGRQVTAEVIDPSGRVVLASALGASNGSMREELHVRSLSPGGYVLRVRWATGAAQQRFTVVR